MIDRELRLGNVYNDEKYTGGNFGGHVWDSHALAPAMKTGASASQQCIVDVKCLNSKGGRGGIEGLQPSLQDRVFDPSGCSFAMTTAFHPNIVEIKDLTGEESETCLAEQSRAEQSRAEQLNLCEAGYSKWKHCLSSRWDSRFELSNITDQKRQGNRSRECESNTDNNEYP